MGIDPQFDMCNNFFCIRLYQGSTMQAVIFGGVDIYVKFRHGVDPYFHLPMYDSTNEWHKVWFFLRNVTVVPLPAFTGNRPVPQPNWGARSGQEGPPQVVILARGHSIVAIGGDDRNEPSIDLFQPPGSTASSMGDYHVDVSGSMLSQLSLL
jgi:hypothetical protein